MKQYSPITAVVLALLLCAANALCQITITWDDIPSTIGTRHVLRTSPGYIPVTLSSPGENQTWDLTGIDTPGEIAVSIVSHDDTPDPSAYPLANWIVQWEDDSGNAACAYAILTPLTFNIIGFMVAGPDSMFSLPLLNWPPLFTFPIHYGDDWNTTLYGEITIGGLPVIFWDSSEVVVDGWGTVITEMGSESCLRLKSHHHITLTLIGIPVFDFSVWAYIWMVPDYPEYAVMVSELNAEEDFTTAMFIRVGSESTADDVASFLPTVFTLENPYPNPFNPQTTIPYSVSEFSDVELIVFNALGQRVRTLVQTWKAPGSYSIVWNGTDNFGNTMGAGTYFCRLQTGELVATQKMILLK